MVVSFMVLFLLTACVSKEKNVVHWQQDRILVLAKLQDMHVSNGAVQGQLKQLNIQISSLQTMLKNMQIEQGALTARLQWQDKKLNTIQAQHLVETQETAQQPLSPLFGKVSQRKKTPAKKEHATNHDEAVAELVLTKPANETKRRKTSVEEKNTYTAAYLAYKSGRFNDAIGSFQLLLNEYANGEYTEPGYYWLAESLLAQKQYKKSLDVFIFYTTHYPKSAKLSAAMLGMARTQLALQKSKSAKKTLNQLIQRFPASTAADQGRTLLPSISH